ncbi:hypothetical protein HTZ77_31855 [Nonomuraea sp. SMC257]|uniref:Conjugal transfer protein TraN n=1 Tax=Nonomuraea montanisoli TaxID=2741721 RepID=A0A7Y6IEA7_9ACTN|nr:hypothetical protein [Nonomuraea montanisoli]NUW35980.1 hypothetical protein [Nonomuraea montanisoli]
MTAERRRIRGVLTALVAVALLAGCSTTAEPPRIPRTQPSWHAPVDDPDAVVAGLCPKGGGSAGPDCRSKVPGYDACVRTHHGRNASALCGRAMVVRAGCVFGDMGRFHDEQDCAASSEAYVSCRTGTPRRSDEVCALGETEFWRCPDAFDPASGFDCAQARAAYYECRDDSRSDHQYCSAYVEVLGLCRTLRVGCSDLLGEYLVCAEKGNSANGCAFGQRVRVTCLRDLADGLFRQASTCDSVWRRALTDCLGMKGYHMDGSTPCVGGGDWRDASYSICEKRGESHETVGVAYVDPQDRGIYVKPLCWATQDGQRTLADLVEDHFSERGVRVVFLDGETRHGPM